MEGNWFYHMKVRVKLKLKFETLKMISATDVFLKDDTSLRSEFLSKKSDPHVSPIFLMPTKDAIFIYNNSWIICMKYIKYQMSKPNLITYMFLLTSKQNVKKSVNTNGNKLLHFTEQI